MEPPALTHPNPQLIRGSITTELVASDLLLTPPPPPFLCNPKCQFNFAGHALHRYDHCSDASYVRALRCSLLLRYTLAWSREFIVQTTQRRIAASMRNRHKYTQLGRCNHDFLNRSLTEIDQSGLGPNDFLSRIFNDKQHSELGPSRAPN